jgi:hypothetical protein
MNLSNRANMTRQIHAPAIAPFDEGCTDLKNRLSPPVMCKYGTIMNGIALLEGKGVLMPPMSMVEEVER